MLSLLLFTLVSSCGMAVAIAAPETLLSIPVRGTVALIQPVAVYNNWSAYDELSDNIELTESLAMKELDQIVRLRSSQR
jgi:hypothetical protein